MSRTPTDEQQRVLSSETEKLIVSASAGSGKTWVLIEYITKLVIEKKVPLRRILVLTFTKAAAGEMKQRLYKSLMEQERDDYVIAQIDDLSIADIATIDGFCEKIIKRNLDKLPLDEGFTVLENPIVLKQRAFDLAIESMTQLYPTALNEIYHAFRKNQNAIFDCVMTMEHFFNATDRWEEKWNYCMQHQAKLHLQAMKIVNEDLLDELERLKLYILKCQEQVRMIEKYSIFCDHLYHLLDQQMEDDLIKNLTVLQSILLPSIPSVKGEERDEACAEMMKALRQSCKTFLESVDKYDFSNPIYRQKVASGKLGTSLLQLYKEYHTLYQATKQMEDVVDFADLENLAAMLLSDENVLASVQDKYDYIFLDEYQDTNRVQEAFIKPIAGKSKFVAVGDPKQGIYGFRNATMEIMQKDVDNFTKDPNGDVIFLRGNFRSDGRVLSFVNRVFEKLITLESVGIDYEKTSELESKVTFEKPLLPSVCIDVVCAKENEKEILPSVYSVQQDEIYISEKDKLEVETICARIDACLALQIYDAKLKSYRPVSYRDITILLRSRSTLMSALAKMLQKKGYPAISDEKKQPIAEPEVQVLLHLLGICLNPTDDVALTAVLLSRLGNFTMDTLAQFRINFPDIKTFHELFYAQQATNKQVFDFMQKLETFKLNCGVLSIYEAYMQWFQQVDYDAYLAMQPNGMEKRKAVYAFLSDITRDNPYDMAKAFVYGQQIGGRERNSFTGSADAINIMTIHGSKGLEYPIVILAGAGQKLESVRHNPYELHEKYGIGTYIYDEKHQTKASSPLLEVIRKTNKHKEMIDELMIFYVAMTRAQNHLYIVGSAEIDKIDTDYRTPLQCRNYLELIFYALGRPVLDTLKQQEEVVLGDWKLHKIDAVQSLQQEIPTSIIAGQPDENYQQVINQYFDFVYPDANFCKFHLKNSVTGITAMQNSMQTQVDYLDSMTQKANFGSESMQNELAIETGNAYHEALQRIDFEAVTDLESCRAQLKKIANKCTSQLDLVDAEILFQNIKLLKPIIQNKQIYKEKQFIMKTSIRELTGESCDHEVLVQGVVDLFAIGDPSVLIDFKYTQENNPEKIIKKYQKQIELYRLAIEKSFQLNVKEKYILSLKHAKLIPIN